MTITYNEFKYISVNKIVNFSLILSCTEFQIGNQIFQCIGDKAAAFLGYTNAGATMVYGQLVDSNYLNSLAIKSYNWNSTVITDEQVETLAYIAEGLDHGRTMFQNYL